MVSTNFMWVSSQISPQNLHKTFTFSSSEPGEFTPDLPPDQLNECSKLRKGELMSERMIWNYWFVVAVFLAAGLLVWPPALYLSMLATVVYSVHMYRYSPRITSFPMQVRLVYLGMLVLGTVPYFGWVLWAQLAGAPAKLIFDYCPLARMLSLAPWNRNQPMSWEFFKSAIFSRPVKGSIIEEVSPDMVGRLHPGMESA
jgi:hypothetical protein